MPKNIDKDSSKLVLSNGSTIDSSSYYDTIQFDGHGFIAKNNSNNTVGVFPNTGTVNNSHSSDFTLEPDYQERFKRRRKQLKNLIKDDKLAEEVVYEFVKTGNKAVWQDSKDE